MEYMAKGNEKEAMTLEKVLFTVLGATYQDLAGLTKVREKNNSGLLSYFIKPSQISVAKPMKLRQQTNVDLSMEFD
jgi:hypothetical protein